MSNFDYKAFITYSHADAKAAAWLQHALESYRVPTRLVGKKTPGGKIERRIGVLFRDRDELPAGADLTQSINTALKKSDYLIVICSPAARESHWVNLEIAEFKKSHNARKILCVIVDGEPFAMRAANQQSLECFPEALGYQDNSIPQSTFSTEPIAADMRSNGDGRRLAKLKIISGLLGVGLDELVQRDSQRRNRNMLAVSMASIAGMVVMSILSIITIDARNGEEQRRAEAEDLIEFMLTDLRDRLDAVGRLDVLDAVGEKAIEYYSNVELSEHSESSLGRRARAFHLLGEVDDVLGDMESARTAFNEAYQTTHELLSRSPNDGERIFNHAQSVFWMGNLDRELGNFEEAESAFIEYLELARQLTIMDPSSVAWLIELASAYLVIGAFTLETKGAAEAIAYFEDAHTTYGEAVGEDSEDSELLWQYGNSYAYLADAYEGVGALAKASEYRSAEADIYRNILDFDPGNQNINLSLLTSHHARADISLMLGQLTNVIDDLLQAKQYGDTLLALDPKNTDTIESTARVYSDLAIAHSYKRQFDSALELSGVAKKLISQLVTEDSNVFIWKKVDISIRIQHSNLLIQSGDPSSAIAHLAQISEEIDEAMNINPEIASLNYLLAENYFTMSKAYSLLNDEYQLRQLAGSTIETLSAVEEELPLLQMAILANAYRLNGDEEEANELILKLESINFRHPEHTAILNW